MTYAEIGTLAKIHFDNLDGNVNDDITITEFNEFLNKGYIAWIKDNVRQDNITALSPLVVEGNSLVKQADYFLFYNGEVTITRSVQPYKNIPIVAKCYLIPHTAHKPLSNLNYNRYTKASLIEKADRFELVLDKDSTVTTIKLYYVKQPVKIDISSTDEIEIKDEWVNEVINNAIMYLLESVQSPRLQTKQAVNNDER